MLFFDTAPVSQYVVNEGGDKKRNSMDSVGLLVVLVVDIENVVRDYVMSLSAHCYGLFETRPTWSVSHVLGNQRRHFDQL